MRCWSTTSFCDVVVFFIPEYFFKERILLNLASTSKGITLNDWTSNRNNRFTLFLLDKFIQTHKKKIQSILFDFFFFVERVTRGIV